MLRSMTKHVTVALFVVLAASCSKKSAEKSDDKGAVMPNAKEPAQTDPASAPAGSASAPADPAMREMPVPSLQGGKGRVRVKLPASWTQRPQSIVLENEVREAEAGVQFDVICEEKCTADDLARFPSIIDSTFKNQVQPNVGTGDPAMDAVRLDLKIVEEGEVPNGRFRIGRVTKPAGLQGPYREQLYAVCVKGREGEPAVSAQAWAPIAREAELGPIIVDACKTFEIVR